jgi:hypothetical protein
MNVPAWVSGAASNVAAGMRAVGVWLASTWTGMSPEAKALSKGLAIGFALGAFSVGFALC